MGVPAMLALYLIFLPATHLAPTRRREIAYRYGRFASGGILTSLRLGGARFTFRGVIRSDHSGVILINHQSLFEPAVIFQMSEPFLPRFVARARYRLAPLVGGSLKIADCPLVDPKRDRLGAVDLLRRVGTENRAPAIAIFPEGHRSRDGSILPFRVAGTIALLAGRRVPVITVLSDGAWQSARFGDVLWGLGDVRMRTEVIDEAVSPADPDQLATFLEERRLLMMERLAAWRSESAQRP
jgi:1-acyl-sn-glycerol-3-phosphate acyltransferase